MPVSVAVGSFAKSGTTTVPFTTAAGTGSLTGLSFQPKALLMFAVGSNTDPNTILRPSFGFSSGSGGNAAVGFGAVNATTTISGSNDTATHTRNRDDYMTALGSSASTTPILMKVSSFTSDGAHFTYDNNDTGTYNLWYMALGGTDITQVKVGRFDLQNSTGNQSVTDVGFEPDMVFFLGGDAPAPPTGGASSDNHLSVYLGAAKNSSREAVMCLSSVDALTTSVDCAKYQRTDRCIAFFTRGSTATIDAEAEYVGTTAAGTGGFTINVITAPTNVNPVFYLAIKGGSWNVSSFNTNTAVGTQTVTVPDNHTPKGLFTWGAGKTAGTTAVANIDYSVGAATSATVFWSNTGREVDAATIHNAARGSQATSCIRYLSGASNSLTTSARADLQAAFAANQFAVDWLTAPASALEQLYVTVGDNVGAALVKVVPTETVGLTEATNRVRERIRNNTPENVGITENVVRVMGKTRTLTAENVGLTENFVKKLGKSMTINEGILMAEVSNMARTWRRTLNETVGLLEAFNKHIITPTSTLQASALVLRFSGGAANGTTTESRGGAMSSVAVTDATMNNTWDDITFTQSGTGLTEYRCYYVYNTHATLSAYACEMWIDTTTPGGDSIEIGVGSAATGGTEQGPLADETTAPTAVTFSTAPDSDSAIFLGDIPPLTGRSIWIKRIVPASTAGFSDNQYRLRMSFYANWSA